VINLLGQHIVGGFFSSTSVMLHLSPYLLVTNKAGLCKIEILIAITVSNGLRIILIHLVLQIKNAIFP
jgi:hypothetical protein